MGIAGPFAFPTGRVNCREEAALDPSLRRAGDRAPLEQMSLNASKRLSSRATRPRRPCSVGLVRWGRGWIAVGPAALLALLALLAVVAVVAVVAGGCDDPARAPAPTPEPSSPLVVAVAANFSFTAQQLVSLYAEQTGREVTLSVGSSGVLQRQAREGAPFDLFLSADMQRIEELAAEGVILPETVAPYAEGKLVLWWNRSPDLPTVDDVNHPGFDLRALVGAWAADSTFRFALGNPVHAPYGVAARQALDAWGVELAGDRLVVMEDVRQAWRVAVSGNADAAFAPLSLVQEEEGGVWAEVPADAYAPIRQGLGRLATSRRPTEAEAFRVFLLGGPARAIIAAAGYGLPAPRPDAPADPTAP